MATIKTFGLLSSKAALFCVFDPNSSAEIRLEWSDHTTAEKHDNQYGKVVGTPQDK